jgi:hypothetical protein
MRQGFSCLLIEAQPGRLAELRRCLEGWRIDCRSPSLVAPTAAEADLLLLELGAEMTPRATATLAVWQPQAARRWACARLATTGHCRRRWRLASTTC